MRTSSNFCHNLSRKIVNRRAQFLCHHHHASSHRVIVKSHNHYQKLVNINCLTANLSSIYGIILFPAPTDDEQSDLSAMSSATPSAASFLMGNRFFGPDFNIDQLRCKLMIFYRNKVLINQTYPCRLCKCGSCRWRQLRSFTEDTKNTIAKNSSDRC